MLFNAQRKYSPRQRQAILPWNSSRFRCALLISSSNPSKTTSVCRKVLISGSDDSKVLELTFALQDAVQINILIREISDETGAFLFPVSDPDICGVCDSSDVVLIRSQKTLGWIRRDRRGILSEVVIRVGIQICQWMPQSLGSASCPSVIRDRIALLCTITRVLVIHGSERKIPYCLAFPALPLAAENAPRLLSSFISKHNT